ncbi:hypothetical protein [Agrobacterium rosae]|uniref:Putative addiction module killer protein n=1 Tax=Agrobacterium rosae TaxID=1972867 RepID=A0A1R3U270_9HYPH|nr:hypothetical protein [Agrobacterium rosae]SCX35187.1 putative addiction module killer protein [Agrobacterium rosae]
MNTFEKSQQFDSWLKARKDTKGKVRILHRITAAENGNFGDWKPVGEDVSEMRLISDRDIACITRAEAKRFTCC